MARKKKTKKKLEDLPGQDDPKAELDAELLLKSAAPILKALETDLLNRAQASPAVTEALKARHAAERTQERTADDFEQWQRAFVTQVSAAWFLSCVFVRTLEDRGLTNQTRIAGPGAGDSQTLFFELAPHLTERDYLLTTFEELAHFEAAKDLFDEAHNPVWLLAPSAEAAKNLLRLFRTPTADSPAFRFGQPDTRFLGDLYQDLSEAVRKRYALLQTPRFVESFILDQTLEPAIEKFGLDDTTLIDPTCGSGHFLLGAFDRLFEHQQKTAPNQDPREAAEKALDAVYGADINPYAVAIARFRLTLSFLQKAGYQKLAKAPKLPLHLVVADSLLHNPHHAQGEFQNLEGVRPEDWAGDLFALEDEAAARDVLHRKYAAVVGNPPYITVKDPVLRDRYRDAYVAAAGKYSLAAPFCERFFQLGREEAQVGMITANSFMKREFGKRLIQEYLPTVNLTTIVNTSGAYIPGHGTPTVLLFGTTEPPQSDTVHTVLASRGEPTTPDDPEQGQVWSSIAAHWKEVGFENDYITVAEVDRASLAEHPWSLSGGGASELKAVLEERAEQSLGDIAQSIGITSFTLEDEVYLRPMHVWERLGVPNERRRPMVIGEAIRDWSIDDVPVAFFPYDTDLNPIGDNEDQLRPLWPWRTCLANNKLFGGKTKVEGGLKWYEFGRLTADKLKTPLTIPFAFVATHNHFVLDRGGKVFNRSAPIIKLPETATEDDHLALLAYLNSSTACFWMKQVFFPKGSQNDVGDTKGKAGRQRYEFAGTGMQALPIPPQLSRLTGLGRELDARGRLFLELEPLPILCASTAGDSAEIAERLKRAEERQAEVMAEMVFLQEEVDWLVYEMFGLVEDPKTASGGVCRCKEAERPYIIRADVNGKSQPEVPASWQERVAELGKNKRLRSIEHVEYKRRWTGTQGVFQRDGRSYADKAKDAIGEWASRALEETFHDVAEPRSIREIGSALTPAAREALAAVDPENERVLRDLMKRGAVPFLSTYVYSGSGLGKHRVWKEVWDKQRRQDSGENIEAEVPPRYKPNDFTSQTYWSLRGKLDVPKERFISYPGCESDEDKEPVYGWAGWDHLQRAQALAALYQNRKNEEGWSADRLTPMLAGLLELIPWVKQWHNEPSEEFGGLRLGDYFESFLDAECQALGLTRDDLTSWRPPEKKKSRKKSAKKKKTEPQTDEPVPQR